MSRCNVILFITTFRQLINNRTGHLNNINYNKYNTGKIKKLLKEKHNGCGLTSFLRFSVHKFIGWHLGQHYKHINKSHRQKGTKIYKSVHKTKQSAGYGCLSSKCIIYFLNKRGRKCLNLNNLITLFELNA